MFHRFTDKILELIPDDVEELMKPETFIDISFEKINKIDGLFIDLYLNQQLSIAAMIDLENNQKLVAKYHNQPTIYNITTTAGVLSEPTGSGKTIIVLGVIVYNNKLKNNINITSFNNSRGKGLLLKNIDNIFNITIVVVGLSVLQQWISAINTYTKLRLFIIKDRRTLIHFYENIKNKNINMYDIIIVKNGKISKSIILPDIDYDNLFIYGSISNIIQNDNSQVERVIVDDIDTNTLHSTHQKIPAKMTWYVSSTTKNDKKINKSVCTKYKNITDVIKKCSYSDSSIFNNRILFYNLNIRTDPDIIKNISNMPIPVFYVHLCKNPHGRFINYLSMINGYDIIIDMLNSDSIETAAEQIGIKSNSVAEIFRTILGTKFEEFKHSSTMLTFIEFIENTYDSLPEGDESYSKADLLDKKKIINKKDSIPIMLKTSKIEFTESKHTSGLAIERVQNNIKDDECIICTSSLTNDIDKILILRCCGILLCKDCCLSILKMSIKKTCPKCRNPITVKSLIYLNENIQLDDITNEKINYEEVEEEKEFVNTQPKEHDDKYDILYKIISNEHTDKIKVNWNRDLNIIKGLNDKSSNNTYSKVLVFTMYDESVYKLKTHLRFKNVKFWILNGAVSTREKIKNDFDDYNGNCALIINATRFSAGLNLQKTATNIVIMHKIDDPDIMTQLIGRVIRIGRTSMIDINIILYKQEYTNMLNTNTISISLNT